MDTEKLKQLAEAGGQLPGSIPVELDPLMELHVDGDYAAYYFSGNDETSLATAKANFRAAIEVVRTLSGAGGLIVVHLSHQMGDKGKRFKIATVKGYQAQRDGDRKPKNWEGLRSWLETNLREVPGYKVAIWMDREADDGVAAAARYAWQTGRRIGIFSRDKDFRMIPGEHIVWTTYDIVKFRPETWEVRGPDGEVYGQKWFWLQMLMGDTADNIPGLEKQPAKKEGTFKTCGEACAEVRLMDAKNPTEAYAVVKGLYQAYYGGSWADRFVEQAALLWLRVGNRAEVDDFLKTMPFVDREVTLAAAKLKVRVR